MEKNIKTFYTGISRFDYELNSGLISGTVSSFITSDTNISKKIINTLIDNSVNKDYNIIYVQNGNYNKLLNTLQNIKQNENSVDVIIINAIKTLSAVTKEFVRDLKQIANDLDCAIVIVQKESSLETLLISDVVVSFIRNSGIEDKFTMTVLKNRFGKSNLIFDNIDLQIAI